MSRSLPSGSRAVPAAFAALVAGGILAAGAAGAGTHVGSLQFTLGAKSLAEGWHVGSPNVDARGDTVSPGRPAQPALGVELTWGLAGWPVLLALDVVHSYDDGIQRFPARFTVGQVGGEQDTIDNPPSNLRRRARVLEVALGIRRSVLVKGFSPYLGAGATWVRANVVYELSDPSQGQFGSPIASVGGQDRAIGWWAAGGVYRRLGQRFQIGVGARYSKATLWLPGSRVFAPKRGDYYIDDGPVRLDAGGRQVGLVVGWSFPSRK